MALTRAELIAAGVVIPGSSSAESFVPTGSTVPSNGLYLSSANTVAIATNSGGRLFIDANGRINQGTVAAFFAKDHTNTSKIVQFQSARTGETVFNLASFEFGFDSGGSLLSFTKSRSTDPTSFLYLANNQTIGRIVFSGDDGFGFTPGAAIVSTTDQASGITAPNMVAGTSYKIYSVGTTNFTSVGAGSNTVGTVFAATGSTTGNGEVVPANGSTAANLRFMTTPFGSSFPQERLRITSSGLVGVGTTSPVSGATKVTVNGDISLAGGARSFLSNLYYDTAWKYVQNGSAFGIIESAGKTLFGIAGNNVSGPGAAATVSYPLTITSTNRIGINSTDPPQMLTMSGGNAYLLSNTSYSPQVIVENNTDDATAGYFILSKSRAGTKNLTGDNLGTLLWRATSFDNAMSNTATSLICNVTETPTAAGLVRTALSITSDRYIRFSTINGEAARITDSNLLFIGHTSSQPVAQTGAKLEISGGDIGSVNIIRRSDNSFGANMYFAKSRNTAHNQYTILQSNDELGSIFFCGDDGTDFNHAGAIIRAYVDANSSPIAQDKMPGGLIFMTNPGVNTNDTATPRMYITPHGHFGINNYPGQATLFRITGYGDGFGGYHNTLTVEPTLYGTAASAEARCILTYPLTQANATVNELAHILCAQNTFDATSTVTAQVGLKILSNLTGATNNFAVVTALPSNTKGAGGANTNYNLYIDGTAPSYFNSSISIRAGQDPNAALRVGTQDSGSGKYAVAYVNTNNQNLGFIRADGQWSTGNAPISPTNNTTAIAANLYVDSSGIIYKSTSSIRYKKNIETIEDTYADAVLGCRPVWYQSKTNNENPNWGFWGFIAEEVAEIDPRLVIWKTKETILRPDYIQPEAPKPIVTIDQETGEERVTVLPAPVPSVADYIEVELDEPIPDGVQYDRFVPLLLNLIKRQKAQIEGLEERLNAAGL